MSGGQICKCSEKDVPIVYPAGVPEAPRLWRVHTREGNHSAFSGYAFTPSAYSAVTCLRCGAVWRTKAGYVRNLKDIANHERGISSGHAGHVQAMAILGRVPHDNHCDQNDTGP